MVNSPCHGQDYVKKRTFINDESLHFTPTVQNSAELWLSDEFPCQIFGGLLTEPDSCPGMESCTTYVDRGNASRCGDAQALGGNPASAFYNFSKKHGLPGSYRNRVLVDFKQNIKAVGPADPVKNTFRPSVTLKSTEACSGESVTSEADAARSGDSRLVLAAAT